MINTNEVLNLLDEARKEFIISEELGIINKKKFCGFVSVNGVLFPAFRGKNKVTVVGRAEHWNALEEFCKGEGLGYKYLIVHGKVLNEENHSTG